VGRIFLRRTGVQAPISRGFRRDMHYRAPPGATARAPPLPVSPANALITALGAPTRWRTSCSSASTKAARPSPTASGA